MANIKSTNHHHQFIPLNNHNLLTIELVIYESETGMPTVQYRDEVLRNNLVMSESSLPRMITEIVLSLLNVNDLNHEIEVPLNKLTTLTSVEFKELRIARLILDSLYSDTSFNNVWQGGHDFKKVYASREHISGELRFFTAYNQIELVKQVLEDGKARLERLTTELGHRCLIYRFTMTAKVTS